MLTHALSEVLLFTLSFWINLRGLFVNWLLPSSYSIIVLQHSSVISVNVELLLCIYDRFGMNVMLLFSPVVEW